MTAATPPCQQGGCGMALSVASALKGGRGAGRPACAVVMAWTSTGRPASATTSRASSHQLQAPPPAMW